jgi:hypothetical protein
MEKVTKRIVVGFDLRKESSLNNLYMTSYDEHVRYEDIYDELQDCINGLNLFFVEPSTINQLGMPGDARVIAFDLPDELVQCLLHGNVSPPYPLPKIDLKNEWDFIGFDVVDPITQTSAFHGFTPSIPVERLIGDAELSFNSHGLLDDIEVALKVAIFCSENIPEHAPFSPCGIWLKKTKQN